MAAIKRLSLVDQVYDKVRERIVTLQIPFGAKLNVSKLQEEYGVSSTPVREALNRLLNDGLIEFENNVGAHVVDITEDDVRQIQELSFAYSMVAARNALRYGDRGQMAEEIRGYIDTYRDAANVLESCKCIRSILENVFYKNIHNDMILAKITSLNSLDDVLHSLFSLPTEYGRKIEQYDDGLKSFEKIYDSVKENDFAGVCDGLEMHRLWSRNYILYNLKVFKEQFPATEE